MSWNQALAMAQGVMQQASSSSLPAPMSEHSDCSAMEPDVATEECHRASETYTLLGSDLASPCGDSPAQPPAILEVLASLLERVVACNESHVQSSGSANKLTVFHGLRAPTISVDKYLERIYKYANCSPSCFVVAYAYMDRLIHRHPELPITSLNVHRLLVTSIMVAAKFLDDAYFNNAYYAKVGGVTTGEMNRLELEFLFRLDFRLHVTTADFGAYCAHLEHQLRLSQVAAMERPMPALREVAEEGEEEQHSFHKGQTGGGATPTQKGQPHGGSEEQDGSGGDVAMRNAFDVHTPPREREFYGPPAL
eukprot:jgi/Mesen1/7518/ME000039S06738